LVANDDGTIRFTHDLIQEAVLHDMGPAGRSILHRRIAEELERLSPNASEGPVAEIAWHFTQGQEPNRALPYVLRAGDRAAAVFAHAEAERAYTMARELAHQVGDAETESQALTRLGRIWTDVGKYDEALRVLETAAARYEAMDDVVNLGQVLAGIGWVHALNLTAREGLQRLEPVVEKLAAHGPSETLVEMYLRLTNLYFIEGQYESKLLAATRAAEIAQQVGSESLLARTNVTRADSLLILGDPLTAQEMLGEAIPILENAGLLDAAAFAHAVAAAASLRLGRPESARSQAEHAASVAGEVEVQWILEEAGVLLGRALFLLGEWPAAADHLTEVARDPDARLHAWAPALALLYLAEVRMMQGDEGVASAMLEECAELVEVRDHVQVREAMPRVLAELDLRHGRAGEARARLETVHASDDQSLASCLPVLARACLELDDLDAASTTVERAFLLAERIPNAVLRVEALEAQTHIWARRGSLENTIMAADEMVSDARSIRYRYMEGRGLELRGALERLRGQDGVAKLSLLQALSIMRELGAKPDVGRIESELATTAP
jgi:tetratricopeptide (TPR) repeat protein